MSEFKPIQLDAYEMQYGEQPQCGTENVAKAEERAYARLAQSLDNPEQLADSHNRMKLRMDVKQLAQGGTKYDSGKPDLSLLPKPALEGMAKALMFGEQKYGRYNYTQGFDSHRLVAAALRHITAWQDGETNDPESGLNHIDHALASLAMLLHCQELTTLVDTRLKKD